MTIKLLKQTIHLAKSTGRLNSRLHIIRLSFIAAGFHFIIAMPEVQPPEI